MNRRESALLRANQIVVSAKKDFNRSLEATKATKPDDGFIYFIGADHQRLVKIGWTGGSPQQRMRKLQTANGSTLELLAAVAGTRDDEQRVHSEFLCDQARDGERSEWFVYSDRLRILLRYLSVGVDPITPQSRQTRIEAYVREQFGWLIGRTTYDESLIEACHRALSVLR